MLDDIVLHYSRAVKFQVLFTGVTRLICTIGFDHRVSRFHFERMVFSLVSYAGSIERPKDFQVK